MPRSGRSCRNCSSESGAGIVIVADRNFCTSKFFFGLAAREAYFVIRQHASTLTWKLRGRRRRVGRVATGMVYEQGMALHFQGETLSVRRVTLVLDRPTESGDTEIHIVTNLSAEQATARQVAQAYGTRWTGLGGRSRRTSRLHLKRQVVRCPRRRLRSASPRCLSWPRGAETV